MPDDDEEEMWEHATPEELALWRPKEIQQDEPTQDECWRWSSEYRRQQMPAMGYLIYVPTSTSTGSNH